MAPADGGLDLSEDVLRTFVGSYDFEGITGLEIELVDGGLVAVIGSNRVPLLAVSEEIFFVAGFGVRLIFTKGDASEVVGVSLEIGGRSDLAESSGDSGRRQCRCWQGVPVADRRRLRKLPNKELLLSAESRR